MSRGEGGLLELIFAGYVRLASQSPCPIIVDNFVASHRPHPCKLTVDIFDSILYINYYSYCVMSVAIRV